MWLYVFGSTVRGEVDAQSDVDVLAVVEHKHYQGDLPKSFLVYSRPELEAVFNRGDLFSHHLASGSRLIYSHDGSDVISVLGAPAPYSSGWKDFESFCEIADAALAQLRRGSNCMVFDCGVLYMAVRDVAMILSYHGDGAMTFSKYAPYAVDPRLSLPPDAYETLKRCRAASTRRAECAEFDELSEEELSTIDNWLKSVRRVLHEGLQIKDRLAEEDSGVS